MPDQKRIRCPVCGMMSWTTALRKQPEFATYTQEGLGQGKGMTFTEDGYDKEILQLELYKILTCLEEMMDKGWLKPQLLLKWIKRYTGEKEKWEEPSEEEVGKWAKPEWDGKETGKWEMPSEEEVGKWGKPTGKWGEPKQEEKTKTEDQEEDKWE